jgi:hypothetical protein
VLLKGRNILKWILEKKCAKFGSGCKLAQDCTCRGICLKVPEKEENFLTGSKTTTIQGISYQIW